MLYIVCYIYSVLRMWHQGQIRDKWLYPKGWISIIGELKTKYALGDQSGQCARVFTPEAEFAAQRRTVFYNFPVPA